MAFDLGTIKKDVDDAVNAATTVADLADRFAALAKKYGHFVPGVGPQIVVIAGLIDTGDKFLHTLKNVLG